MLALVLHHILASSKTFNLLLLPLCNGGGRKVPRYSGRGADDGCKISGYWVQRGCGCKDAGCKNCVDDYKGGDWSLNPLNNRRRHGEDRGQIRELTESDSIQKALKFY
jgi:hypothetical protein